MSVVIRRAKPGDEARIAEFAIKLFEQHVGYDPDRFSLFATIEGAESFYRSQFLEPSVAVLVAELDNRVIGFAYIAKEDRNYAELLENGVWLHDIYIDEPARSAGAGRALIDSVIETAREMGAGKLLLTVAAKNALAQRFFEGIGFRHTMAEMTINLPDIAND